jgi:hypothetical protein
LRLIGRRFFSAVLATSVFAGFGVGAVHAAELYGTDFDVIYDPTTLGLFGSLSLVGNTLEFTPNSFIATSTNGQGVVTPAGVTTASGIQLIANPGFQFGSLQLAELGDYQLSGAGSSVGLSGELIAFNGAENPLATYTTSTITAAGALNVVTGTSNVQTWAASAAITNATPTEFNSGAWLSSASTVDISIENLLSASTTSANSLALIQKKDAFGGVTLTVTPVPLPASAWLFASAVAGLGLATRRRRGRAL